MSAGRKQLKYNKDFLDAWMNILCYVRSHLKNLIPTNDFETRLDYPTKICIVGNNVGNNSHFHFYDGLVRTPLSTVHQFGKYPKLFSKMCISTFPACVHLFKINFSMPAFTCLTFILNRGDTNTIVSTFTEVTFSAMQSNVR